MFSRIPNCTLDWLRLLDISAAPRVPNKDNNNDDDEEDEDDEDEDHKDGEREPAVIREPEEDE